MMLSKNRQALITLREIKCFIAIGMVVSQFMFPVQASACNIIYIFSCVRYRSLDPAFCLLLKGQKLHPLYSLYSCPVAKLRPNVMLQSKNLEGVSNRSKKH